MHICFICNEYPPSNGGGIGTFTQTLARQLVKAGVVVSVIGMYFIDKQVVEQDEGVNVYRVPISGISGLIFLFNSIALQKQLAAINRKTPIDIIEGQENAFAFFPIRTRWKKIIRMHGGHHFFQTELGKRPRLRRSWIEICSFRHADHICAVSNHVAEVTQKLLRIKKSVQVIPNPVDINQFQPILNIPEEEGLIIFVGTVTEKKGVRQLILAMIEIVKSIPRAHLWIIGRDTIDPITNQSFYQGLLASVPENIQHNIIYKGIVSHDHLPEILARAQVCVYPSHMEAMPIAWLEGMAMGKAVVASQTGPGPEVINPGVNGLLCNPYDPVSIAAGIMKFLTDGELRRQLGNAARNTVEDRFSLEVLLQLNIEFYDKCLNKHP